MYLSRKSLISWAFKPVPHFLELHAITGKRLSFAYFYHGRAKAGANAHPSFSGSCVKQGNAKKYSSPLCLNYPSEHFSASRFSCGWRFFHSRSKGTSQSPHTTLTSFVARMMAPHSGQTYLMLRFLDFLPFSLPAPPSGRRLALIASSPRVSLTHASASGASVVIVQPYFWCFSMCRPCASAVALNFML